MKKRKNKYKSDKYGHIEREVESRDENSFEASRDMEDVEEDKELPVTKEQEQPANKQKQSTKESTKD